MRRTLALLVTVTGMGCAGVQVPQNGGPVGCWTSNRPQLGSFELSYDPVSGERHFSPNDWGDLPVTNQWLPIEATDSIRINYGYGGFVGESVRAQVLADSLIGTSLPFTDEVGGSPPSPAEFKARRVECSRLTAGSV
jgi:hypothetical protein